MEKGQISLDLLLTIIVVIIVITSFTFLAQSTRQSQDVMLTQSQLKDISTKTSSFITSTKTISDSNFYIEFKIYTDSKGNNKTSYPEITIIDGNKLRVWLEIDGTILDANNYFAKSLKTTITTTEVKPFGILVISNA